LFDSQGEIMTILIANIGKSDLAIKIDDYYIPVGFDRDEKNVNDTDLDENEKAIWEKNLRQEYICSQLCHELEVPYKKNGEFSFRELTKKILEEYEKNEGIWHHQINPDRIRGVIEKARKEFNLEKVYIFVTNQPEKIIDPKKNEEIDNRGYSTDSIHLFKIIQKWFKKEIPELDIVERVIPSNISAVDQDRLMNYYYKFFLEEITSSQEVLISIKGGTPQMQNALRMQALASSAMKQLFIEPKLSVKCLLAGKPSECQLTSYWRYMRTQKYQDVKNILESRWDFDGALQILDKWVNTLESLKRSGIPDLEKSKIGVELVIKSLELGISYLNLDNRGARNIINSTEGLALSKEFWKEYNSLLNIYTQCRIYWKLNQVANFLSRMASICEETLHKIIINLGGIKYFNEKKYPNSWYLDKSKVEPKLWKYFAEREEEDNANKFKNWDFQKSPYLLSNRFSKRNFVEALVIFRDKMKEIESWERIIDSLEKLDCWVEQRNTLIHSGVGVSKESMLEFINHEREYDKDIVACDPNKILTELTIILAELTIISNQNNKLLNRSENPFVGFEPTTPYYIYSEIKDWVIAKLIADGLE
jgi:hypothetical protein